MVAFAAALILSGCAGQPAKAPVEDTSKLVWPAAPDAPRVRYIQSISRPADVGIKPAGAARVWRWIVGNDEAKERLSKPFGVSVDDAGNVCITDTGVNAVCYYDRGAKVWRRWEKIGRIRFSSPVAAVKRAGIFYVADTGLGCVIAFNEEGQLLFKISDHIERPAGLAIVGDQVVVADSKRHAVVRFDLNGRFISEFGRRGTAPGEFNFPTHVAAGQGGALLVTDSMNSRVQIFDGAGHFKSSIGSAGDAPGHFSRPKGVAVDSSGHVYVIDALFDNIQVFAPNGDFLLTVGNSGERPGQFWLANGIAISRENEIYVADAYNRRVQLFKYVGEP